MSQAETEYIFCQVVFCLRLVFFPGLDEFAGCDSHDLFEYPVEISWCGKSGCEGRFLNGVISVGKHFNGAGHPLCVQVIAEADARLVEQSAQVAHGEPEGLGYLFYSQVLVSSCRPSMSSPDRFWWRCRRWTRTSAIGARVSAFPIILMPCTATAAS